MSLQVKVASKPPQAGGSLGPCLPQSLRRNQPCRHSMLDFQPPLYWETIHFYCLSTKAWGSLLWHQANSYNQSHTTYNKPGEGIFRRPPVSRAESDRFRNTPKCSLCSTYSLVRVNPTRAGNPAVPSLSEQDLRGPLMSLNTQTSVLCSYNPSMCSAARHLRSRPAQFFTAGGKAFLGWLWGNWPITWVSNHHNGHVWIHLPKVPLHQAPANI